MIFVADYVTHIHFSNASQTVPLTFCCASWFLQMTRQKDARDWALLFVLYFRAMRTRCAIFSVVNTADCIVGPSLFNTTDPDTTRVLEDVLLRRVAVHPPTRRRRPVRTNVCVRVGVRVNSRLDEL